MTRCLINTLLLALALAAPAFAAQPCTWHEGTGTAFADEVSPAEAHSTALARARYSALEQGIGVSISGATLVKDNMLLADIVTSMSEGFIQSEQKPVWENAMHPPSPGQPAVPSYTVKLNACVISDSRDRDSFFTLTLTTDQPVYVAGEDISMTLRPGKEAYLGIFHIDEQGSVTMLLPGVHQKSVRVDGGKDSAFPPEGLGLRAKLAPGKNREAETFLSVATREWFDYAGIFGSRKQIPLAQLFTSLRNIPASKRAIAMAPIEVRAR